MKHQDNMKQKFYLSASLLLLGATMSIQAVTPSAVFPMYSSQEMQPKICGSDKRPSKSRSDAEDIDIRVKVDYNRDKYSSMQVLCINDDWSFIIDEVDLESDGYMHFSDTPGIYDFIAILSHTDHDGYTFVIKENYEVSDNSPIVLDAYSAKNHIQFKAVTSTGKDMIGELLENGEIREEGNTYVGYSFTEIYHERHGQIISYPSFLARILDGEKETYGPSEGDIYINDLSDDTEFSAVQVRIGRTAEGMEFVSLEADGMTSQTVTNDKNDFLCLTANFAPHRLGNTHIASNPEIRATETFGYVPVWKGEIFSHTIFQPGYEVDLPNLDKIYVCAPPSAGENSRFEMLPIFGTDDQSGQTDFIGMGFGTLMPLFRITTENKFQFVDNAAVNGLFRDDWTHAEEDPVTTVKAFNDYLSYTIDNGRSFTWGNSVPICIASIGYVRNSDSQLRFSFIGRHGENRNIDNRNMNFEMKADGETISTRPYWTADDFMKWRLRDGEFNSTKAEYRITIENNNVLVDDMQGYNKTTIYYDTNMPSANPPALRSLQFRDSEGKITDRFSSLDEGVVEFYAGDFEYAESDRSYMWFFNYGVLSDVQVEYAPHGSGEWRILDVEEIPEMLEPVAYGAFYRGSLAGVSAESESGWYDLRIKLVDDSDNYQIQEIAPAFCKMTPDSVVSLPTGFSGLDVEVYNTGGILVYKGDYDNCMDARLPQGVYVIKAISSNSVPTRKLIIK